VWSALAVRPEAPLGFAQLLFDLWSGEEAGEGRMSHVVIRREYPQRLARSAASK
jgi:hypothetical protein